MIIENLVTGVLEDIGDEDWINIVVNFWAADVHIHWCYENINESNWKYGGGGKFYFRNTDDAVSFKLRWT
jgi:hypothetical protein